MDFDDTPAEAAARVEARAWLSGVATRRGETRSHDGGGDDGAAAKPGAWRRFRARTTQDDAAHLDEARAWQQTKADAGFAGIHWPEEVGGRGRSAAEASAFSAEEAAFDVPGNAFIVGIDMVGPTVLAHGDDEQRRRWLAPTLRGDLTWCQLFSEPGAGSDLAALGTRAERTEGGWRVSGQKVWTSGAHWADRGMALVRTDPDAAKHKGITCAVIDMRAPGVTVRPLRQIDGAIHFNEVFLDAVAVADADVVGEVGGGWAVAMTMLSAERTAIGQGGQVKVSELVDLARRHGTTAEPAIRRQLVDLHIRAELQRFLGYRARTASQKGDPAAAVFGSVLKLQNSHQVEAVGDAAVAVQGARGTLWHDDADDEGFWQDVFLFQWSSRIGGGTEQVQRSIIGERILGLPKEPDPWKGAPWRDLPKG